MKVDVHQGVVLSPLLLFAIVVDGGCTRTMNENLYADRSVLTSETMKN